MSTVTTESMNEAIAVFDGGIWKEDDYGDHGFFFPNHPKRRPAAKAALKYHTSWVWLMPVVEKIEAMEWCVRIENWPKKFKSPYKEHYSVWMWLDPEDCPEIQTYSDSKIEAVYNAVYQFITWYNSKP